MNSTLLTEGWSSNVNCKGCRPLFTPLIQPQFSHAKAEGPQVALGASTVTTDHLQTAVESHVGLRPIYRPSTSQPSSIATCMFRALHCPLSAESLFSGPLRFESLTLNSTFSRSGVPHPSCIDCPSRMRQFDNTVPCDRTLSC